MAGRSARLLALAAVALAACNEDFSPKGNYEPRLAVYGILNGDRDTQFVRVYSTYNTTGFNAMENTVDPQISDAVVTLSSPESTFVLHDTLVRRIDTTRYQSLIHAYYIPGLRPLPNKLFRLTVNSPTRGSAIASAVVPDVGILRLSNTLIFKVPLTYPTEDILVDVGLSSAARGYVVRMFVDYDISPGQSRRIEVPMSMDRTTDPPQPIYPNIRRGATTSSTAYVSLTHTIARNAYLYALNKAKEGNGVDLHFKKAVIVLYSVDKNLYAYFNIVNGFQDPFSIRTDQPDFSNIQGSVGVFGAFTVDSTSIDLGNIWIDS